MKNLHSLTFYALVTPVIALGAGSVLAESSSDKKMDREQQSSQSYQDNKQDQSQMQSQGYLSSAPANGRHASNLIGAEVKTTNNEEVGSVSDLIIDQKGQVVGIVVGVGGFLGMGEKDVAIGWDNVSHSGSSDQDELQIKSTREDLMSAPEFKTQD
ncbi:PRC-barrel domain-containing protein [Thiohalophilus thiocyanatoxydans]|uniref:Sporulation protein YlmC with PRC-barrel domain n=1 Tax=Thiohalophilus thiocyanatoxydans TaxID=381308 RepID=A0A4R8IVM8_9GAMM|nr:PRC-barrel domain-containing protein [Thiohalophilus thiocyanatoxydans]TDY01759.1 sporulation protein YlmC with PRC-barrel domain [Thiohalophilus thiocyanatoxydans]